MACHTLSSGEYVRRAKSHKGQYGALRRQAGMERRQVAKQTADVPSAQAGDESGPVGAFSRLASWLMENPELKANPME